MSVQEKLLNMGFKHVIIEENYARVYFDYRRKNSSKIVHNGWQEFEGNEEEILKQAVDFINKKSGNYEIILNK